MTNYYVELGLDRSASIEELEQQLKALKKRWTSRASSAATTEKRQQAERMVDLIREASETLLVKDKKAKYDKQIDKDPAASNAQPSSQQQTAVNVDSSNMAGAALLDLVEQFYDSSNYNQAIAVARKAIETGNESVGLYRILALCYAERGDESGSFNALQQMIRKYSDDAEAHFCYARLCLQVLNHVQDAKRSIDWLMENGYGENGAVAALDIEYDIDRGDSNLANQKIDEYLAHNSNDQDFRQTVCRAIAQYADEHKLTEYGGDVYFDTEADMKDWLALYERALQIYPDGSLRKTYDNNKDFAKKTFLKDNWLGIACGVVYVFAGFSSPELAIIGIVALALTVGMVYFSLVPNWQLLRYQYTKKLVGGYEVFRIINNIASFIFRWSWAAVKFIFRLIFSFI